MRVETLFQAMAMAILCLGGSALTARAQEKSPLPDAAGKPLVDRVCAKCHDLESTARSRNSRDRWSEIVDDMISRGAEATDREIEQIIDYLARNLGQDKPLPKLNVNKATAGALAATLSVTRQVAADIVEEREKHGAFKEWADLKRVPGLDLKQIESKKDRIEY